MKQIIIALGREFGSGGHVIAKKLAEHYNIPLYNKELLDEIAKDGHFSKEMLEKFDERPISISFMPMPITGSTISLEQQIAIKQFGFLKKKAASPDFDQSRSAANFHFISFIFPLHSDSSF